MFKSDDTYSFLWIFRLLGTKQFSCMYLHDVFMSYRDVMMSLNILNDVKKRFAFTSACKCAQELIPFSFLLFSWWLNSIWLLISYSDDGITSRTDVMTSYNMLYLSQLVDVLEWWFFFVSIVFWVAEFKNIIDSVFVYMVMPWSDAMTSMHDYMTSQISVHQY